jgi:hypothetical protein
VLLITIEFRILPGASRFCSRIKIKKKGVKNE